MARAWGIATGFPDSGMSGGDRTTYYDGIFEAGFTKVRFDWTGNVGSVSANHALSAIASGLDVLLIIGGTPSDSSGVYSSRCDGAADYYQTIGVTEYELMNEPNLQAWANGAAYGNVAKAGYSAIKTSQPAATVHLGGIASFGDGNNTSFRAPDVWLNSCYTVNNGSVGDWFDSVNIHPYGYWRNFSGSQAMANSGGWPMVIDRANSMRNRIVANGDSDKIIIVTEIGIPTWSDGVHTDDWFAVNFPSDRGMTEAAATDYFTLLINDVATRSQLILGDIYIYSARDKAEASLSGNQEGHFGALWYNDYTPKPSAATIVAGLEGSIDPEPPPQPGDPPPPPLPPPVTPPPAFVGEGISLDGMILRHLATDTPNGEAGLGGIKLSDIKFRAHDFS